MLGKKFRKNNFNEEEYANAAAWCNENNAQIIEKGEYYEVEAVSNDIEIQKKEKIIELKTARYQAEVSPLTYNGYTFDYDEISQARLNDIMVTVEVTGERATIATADNREVLMNLEHLKNLKAAAGERRNLLRNAYQTAKAKVQAAATTEEVQKITL